MGLKFKDIVQVEEIKFSELNNKILVVDTFNMLYQFLSSIRSADGTPLKDSKGNVTSHLAGLFSRVSNLMQKNLKLAFVFDGKPPQLKHEERQRRRQIKEEAKKAYEIAKEREDIGGMKKYAMRTTTLTKEMVDEAKYLLDLMGLPVIQAPSEGEAQVAFMAKKGDADYGVSQDYDSLLYGTPNLVRNLSISGKKKRTSKLSFETIKPEVINLTKTLNSLGLDNDQLIVLAMLVGTDYNRAGIKGIGPKKALKLVKEYGKDFDALFKEVKWEETYELGWNEIYYLFKNMPTSDDYDLSFRRYDKDKILEFLCDKHDFSRQRIESTLQKLDKSLPSQQQKGLGEFF